MGLSNKFDGDMNKRATNIYNMQSSFNAPVVQNVLQKENLLGDLWAEKQLKVNLIASCFTWLLASFNFYLITFYLKYFPGSVFINSICFACSDLIAFASSGIFLQWVTVAKGYIIANIIGFIGGCAYLLNYKTTETWVIPVIVCFMRVGGSMCFNIGYVSVARLFPT